MLTLIFVGGGVPVPVPPVITSISPPSGFVTGGNTVTIIGSNFTGAASVLFGTVPAVSFIVVDDNTITVVPAGVLTPQTVDVSVTTPIGTSPITPADQYTFIAVPVPTSLGGGGGEAAYRWYIQRLRKEEAARKRKKKKRNEELVMMLT